MFWNVSEKKLDLQLNAGVSLNTYKRMIVA